MKIMLLGKGEFCIHTEGVEIANTDKKIDYGDVLVTDGKHYRIVGNCGEMIGVREFTPLGKKETYESDFTCPYCGAIVHEDYECDDEGETECNCGAILKYRKFTEVSYQVNLIKKPKLVEL